MARKEEITIDEFVTLGEFLADTHETLSTTLGPKTYLLGPDAAFEKLKEIRGPGLGGLDITQ